MLNAVIPKISMPSRAAPPVGVVVVLPATSLPVCDGTVPETVGLSDAVGLMLAVAVAKPAEPVEVPEGEEEEAESALVPVVLSPPE